MTNKVKPFYIEITDDMTPQMVQNAFDKCVDAGAVAHEGVAMVERKHSYTHCYANAFGYFGISTSGGTFFADDESSFHCDAQEITLDQLDEWLGSETEEEWSGEGLPPVGVECDILDVNGEETIGNGTIYHVDGNKFFILSESLKDYPEESTVNMFDGAMNLYVMWVSDGDDRFRKPETPEQKAERERIEAAYDLYCNAQHSVDVISYDNFEVFRSDKVQVKFWLSIVDKTGYRKQ